jgi:hypothetical protein
MSYRRPSRTDLALVNTGRWIRVERRRYWHISGAEVSYNPNRWVWVTTVNDLAWASLAVAAEAVERHIRDN